MCRTAVTYPPPSQAEVIVDAVVIFCVSFSTFSLHFHICPCVLPIVLRIFKQESHKKGSVCLLKVLSLCAGGKLLPDGCSLSRELQFSLCQFRAGVNYNPGNVRLKSPDLHAKKLQKAKKKSECSFIQSLWFKGRLVLVVLRLLG